MRKFPKLARDLAGMRVRTKRKLENGYVVGHFET
jgi:hypothetical protein